MYSFSILSLALAAPLFIEGVRTLSTTSHPTNPGSHHQLERRGHNDGPFPGRATWFIPGLGACGGARANTSSMIVALNEHQYGNMDAVSKHRGRSIKITYKDKTVMAKVQGWFPHL
ncbi:hypothetical protein FRB94_004057 [Tulasnella sp. JGI-2019a]|nr:hypothetical protein FRB94_004057 [Tulasnella sp. JGI-2019a]KAG9010371.1 hypothetical protein FRB93_004210 [Tulasnella sp. JGI-2019a]